jgi:hypothetical protein
MRISSSAVPGAEQKKPHRRKRHRLLIRITVMINTTAMAMAQTVYRSMGKRGTWPTREGEAARDHQCELDEAAFG